MFNNKKGFITHPITMAVVAFLLGALVMYLMAKGTIPAPFRVC